MLKNITLSAEKSLIQRARERASAENTSLNAEFRLWLEKYAGSIRDGDEYMQLMEQLAHVRSGGKFSREELNAR